MVIYGSYQNRSSQIIITTVSINFSYLHLKLTVTQGVEVGFLTSGFFGFGYFPLGESGFGVFKFLWKYPQNS